MIFVLPIVVVGLLVGMIPSLADAAVHSHSPVFAITWAEFFTWILATPVQFVSGLHLLPGGLVARDEAASVRHGVPRFRGDERRVPYSVFAVVYNAAVPPDPSLDALLETSALLITFVVFGKFIEAMAKAKTSQAADQALAARAGHRRSAGRVVPRRRARDSSLSRATSAETKFESFLEAKSQSTALSSRLSILQCNRS